MRPGYANLRSHAAAMNFNSGLINMGRLFLIHDFSSSRPWLYALLNANRKLLSGQGLEFGPFNPFSVAWQFDHEHFFRAWTAKNPPTARILDLWKRLDARLQTGADVLLFTHKPHVAPHRGFWEMLANHAQIAPENIRQLFIIAPPAAIIEQRFREFPNLGAKAGEDLAAAYGNLLLLTTASGEHIEPANVKIIANLQPEAASRPLPDLGRQVLEFLGVEASLEAANNFLHPLRFQSAVTRKLSGMGGTRGNNWKPLNFQAYARALVALDQTLPEDYASPLSLRQQLAAPPQMALLERKLELPNNALRPVAELLSREPRKNPAPLTAADCAAFAKLLPEAARQQLIERYLADEIILTPEQKLLLSCLRPAPENGDAAEATHIGNAEPPVELTVLTMTFNQEKYIAECMDGVLMQKTDFPVRHIVLDHNSSDATPRIIREYAARHPSIQPVLLSRRTPSENVRGLFMRCHTKYAALCDGDDYFTSPDKLQKQVDYLEQRPHCAMCFHPVTVTFEDGSKPFTLPTSEMLPASKRMEFHLAQLTRHNFIQTNSAVYRWRFRDGLPAWFRADLCPGDWYWHLLHAETGRVGFLPETMAVYRRHKGALYNNAFRDPEAHWRARGLNELAAYKAYSDHFHDRYFRNFSILASGIFATFLRISEKEGDSSLLDRATELYPRFALDFYKSVNNLLDGQDDSCQCE